MKDRRQKRLELLCRLREMHLEKARADHVAAQTELETRRAQADDTQRRIQAIESWTHEQLTQGPLAPELLRQAEMCRVVERRTLLVQRGEEQVSQERTEEARRELGDRFEQLSVAERLTVRHARIVDVEQIRRGYVELDEAATRKPIPAKE
jgi:hypothetical protein